MNKKIKLALKSTFPFFLWNKFQQKKEFATWQKGQFPIPRMQKQKIIKELGERFQMNCMVETGTYLGEMIFAQLDNFQKIYSIEIDQELFKRAQRIFSSKTQVEVMLGNSGEVLPMILDKLEGPALFWLDGHFSGGVTSSADIPSPILQELKHIFSCNIKGSVILIDDANIFNGTNNCPSIDEIRKVVEDYDSSLGFEVDDNIIRIFPLV